RRRVAAAVAGTGGKQRQRAERSQRGKTAGARTERHRNLRNCGAGTTYAPPAQWMSVELVTESTPPYGLRRVYVKLHRANGRSGRLSSRISVEPTLGGRRACGAGV